MFNFSHIRMKFLIFALVFAVASSAYAGNFKGRVVESTTNEPQSNIVVILKEKKIRVKTDKNGEFVIRNIESGDYTLQFPGRSLTTNELKIKVTEADEKIQQLSVTFRTLQMNDVEVYSSNRRLQKITEAPSAISVVSAKEIELATSHGQLSKTLENIQGVDVVQSGMNDFNVNTRGFNNSINRRVLVLIDGRDPSTPLLNLMEWNSLQTNLADVSKIEVVRGPGSALYGANAYNGVINITTNAPKDVLGTRVSVTGGEFNTLRADARNAGNILDNLYYKVNVGYATQKQAWISSRDTTMGGTLEYAGLVRDVTGYRAGVDTIKSIATLIDDHKIATSIFGTARFDYELNQNSTLLAEFGYSRYGNEYFVNQTGRILIPDIEKPFARLAYNSKNWNVQAHWSKRYSIIPQIVMNAAASSGENSDDYVVDAQWNDSFLDDKLKIVAGASQEYQNVISAVAGSAALLSPDSIRNNFSGVYAQFEYSLANNLQAVFAARMDRSSLFETQFSPKGAIVWTPITDQTFRFTVNRSFLRPSYSDYQRRSAAGAPLNYNAIDSAIAAQFGISKLGLSLLPQWNMGNPTIGVESAMSYEFGYKGVVTKNLYITADIYLNDRSNFISNPLGGLAPNVYIPVRYSSQAANDSLKAKLSRINPAYYDRLSIDPVTGKPALIVAPKNIGLVSENGFELGANYYLNDQVMISANYTHLGFRIKENEIAANKILPNTSANKFNFGVNYEEKNGALPFNVSLQLRGVEGFKWIAGFYEGYVPEYWVTNLSGGVSITKDVKLGVNIFNLLNRKHYEIFGGTFLERYATATLSYTF